MVKKFREFKVFIASPGDLAPERKIFRDTIEILNKGYGEGAGIKFIPYGWEDEPATTGFRVQSVINEQVDQADLFVLVLHRRWGQKASDSAYSSYTEEEFYLAFHRWELTQKPVIMIFFKNIDSSSLADPGSQLKKVLKFKQQLNKLNVLHRPFATETDFGEQLDKHLRAFAEGRWDILNKKVPRVELSEKNMQSLQKSELAADSKIRKEQHAREKSTTDVSRTVPDKTLVLAEKESLVFARAAITNVNAGNMDDARVLFAKATAGTTNLSVLSIAAEFYRQTGDHSNANLLVRRMSAIANDREIAARQLLLLMPPGYIKELQDSILKQLTSTAPDDSSEILMEVQNEMNRRGIWERYYLDMMVRNYSAEEIMALAQLYSTAEGQSIVYKQSMISVEAMQFGTYAFLRVAAEMMGENFNEEVNPVFDQVLQLTGPEPKPDES